MSFHTSHTHIFLGSTLMCFSTFRKRKREKFAVEIQTDFLNKFSLNDCIVVFLLVSNSRSFGQESPTLTGRVVFNCLNQICLGHTWQNPCKTLLCGLQGAKKLDLNGILLVINAERYGLNASQQSFTNSIEYFHGMIFQNILRVSSHTFVCISFLLLGVEMPKSKESE